MKSLQRWPVVGAVGALLVGALLLDRVPPPLPPSLEATNVVTLRSAIVEPPSLTTSWYCPIGSSERGGFARHTINVSNVSDQAATATVSIITDDGPGASLRLELDPYRTQSVDLSSVDSSASASAVVEIVGGNAVVGHDVSTIHGDATGPCATAVSGQWYFASGSTRRDSDQFLALLNPFGEDVVLDVTFRTATRERRPEDLSSLVVPGRTVRIINVSDFVSLEAVVATSVTAIQGRVVAEQLQTANGELGPLGAALVLGTPEAATKWTLPAGRISVDGDHHLVIHNPGPETAELELLFDLATTDRRATYGLNAVDLSVQPGRLESLDVGELIRALSIPLPLEIGLRVSSENGVPVVVSRSQLHPMVDNTLVGAEDTGSTVAVAGSDESGDAPTGEDAIEVDEGGQEALNTIDPSTIERRDPIGGSLVRQTGDDDQEDISVDDLLPDVAKQILDDSAQATASKGMAISNGSSKPSTDWVVPYIRIAGNGATVMLITAPEDALVEIRGMVDGSLLEPQRVAVSGQTRRVVPLVLPVSRTALQVSSSSLITIEIQTVLDGQISVSAAVPVVQR